MLMIATATARIWRTGTDGAYCSPMISRTKGSAKTPINTHSAAPPAGNHIVERIRPHTSRIVGSRAATGTNSVVKVLLASMIGCVHRLTAP